MFACYCWTKLVDSTGTLPQKCWYWSEMKRMLRGEVETGAVTSQVNPPLVRKEPLGLRTLVRLKELVIAKTGSEKGRDA